MESHASWCRAVVGATAVVALLLAPSTGLATDTRLAARPSAAVGLSPRPEEGGPSRASQANPRYFTDEFGVPRYLAGSHTWNNLVDMDATLPARRFDFDAYLEFLEDHGHNFVRLWTWEVPRPDSERYERRQFATPQPWARTGPGKAIDGLPRFDLETLDPEYMTRLRQRTRKAVERGFTVSVMLFEGWAVQFAPGKTSHPFNGPNNVNGIQIEDEIREVHTLRNPEITELQLAYVRGVIDAVNDLDGILYEICNECGGYSNEWQILVMETIREYESTKPKQHPVGMTFQWKDGDSRALFDTSADWIGPGWDVGHYAIDPEPATGEKVILSDTDHLWGSAPVERSLVWRSFTRGLNFALMDRYVGPDSVTDQGSRHTVEARIAMGDTVALARHLDLRTAVPRSDVASSGHALVSPDEMLIYTGPTASETGLTVDLSDRASGFAVEWFDPETGRVLPAEDIEGGLSTLLSPPCAKDCVLYLRTRGSERPALVGLEPRFEAIRTAARSHLDAVSRLRLSASAVANRMFLERGLPGLAFSLTLGFVLGAAFGGLTYRTLRSRRGPPGSKRA